MKRVVVLGMLGPTLDGAPFASRWERWRPTVDLCRQDDLVVHRLDVLHAEKFSALMRTVRADIASVSPETEVCAHPFEVKDPWDFEEMFAALHDFARRYPFDPDREEYLVHMTTGTHVGQICLFLLTESRHFPARILQTHPAKRHTPGHPGHLTIIDLDLSRYDRIATRFRREQREALDFLKSGIATRSARYNELVARIEKVASSTRAPLLLLGPTGAGKSRLARRIFELKKARRLVEGAFVEVNCATLRGDASMSALFGHVKGAFTGAVADRPGLMRAADRGVLFLDELGELGLDEQAMLLRAIEERTFLPVGSDREAGSDFQLIAGTNRDLHDAVRRGTFRDDLLARIKLWTFRLPGLAERREDLEPNLDHELERIADRAGVRASFNREARDAFLAFATSPRAAWTGNFREFNGALERMATLAPSGRIGRAQVDDEIDALEAGWRLPDEQASGDDEVVGRALARAGQGPEALQEIDPFDRVQLAFVLRTCAGARSLSDAGRRLFAASRRKRQVVNDADRIRKYLARFGLSWQAIS